MGIGEDGVDGLGARARAAIAGAALVVGGARHLALADPLIGGERMAWPSPMRDGFAAILSRRGSQVAVLASGDPFCFGVGNSLAGLVPPPEMTCLPAPSAFSLAAARLRWALQDVATVSLCGRPVDGLLPFLQDGARVLVLSADATTPAQVAALLCAHGFGASALHVLEALGGPRERWRTVWAHAGVPEDVQALNMMAIELEGAAGPALSAGLPDDTFDTDGQLTKWEVRAATLAALAPRPGELLWDIGAGSGSVSIEWCRHDRSLRAIAVEARAERAARVAANARRLLAGGVRVVEGTAPGALAGLPAPDAVFIGGGLTTEGVWDAAWGALRPGGRLVANAVALDTQALLFAAQGRWGGTLTRLAVERLDRVGAMRAFRPAMAVVQWAVRKP